MSPLEVTEPVFREDLWFVTIATTVLYLGKHAPNPPVEVVITVDGEEAERVTSDDESGRVTCETAVGKVGGHIIYASLANAPSVRSSKRISAKKESKSTKAPKFLNVSVTGERGKQGLLISVSDEEGTLIGGFTGTILDGDEKKSFTTDSDGTCLYKTEFSESSHVVEVRVGNSPNQIWTEALSGPKK
ncbi:hypothetical protein D4R51_00435 [bacterium]|nr:MAG: hypothetical protein D4R51_00435 [bacterium]